MAKVPPGRRTIPSPTDACPKTVALLDIVCHQFGGADDALVRAFECRRSPSKKESGRLIHSSQFRAQSRKYCASRCGGLARRATKRFSRLGGGGRAVAHLSCRPVRVPGGR